MRKLTGEEAQKKLPPDLRVKKGEVQIKSGYSEMFKENFINNLKEYKETLNEYSIK